MKRTKPPAKKQTPTKRVFSDIHRQRLSENKKKFYNKPEPVSKLCDCGCGNMTKPGNDFIRGHNQRGKDFNQEHKDKVRENRKGIPVSEERKKQISITLKELYKDKEKHPRWLGGLSLQEYGKDFNFELKQKLRKRDGNFCQLCGQPESAGKQKLSIHHIDYNKQNNEKDNLISLCRSCHTKTNNKHRRHWSYRLSNRKKQDDLDYSKAILCGDFHIRDTIPTCRTDDFLEAQTQKLIFIKELQKTHNCPVIFSGDLFDHWKSSPYLLTLTLNYLPEYIWVVAGNHDLPQHNIELLYKSGLNTLIHTGAIRYLKGTHWGQQPLEPSIVLCQKKILVWHVMTYQGKEPWPGCTDQNAKEILASYPDYPLIVTGHNHKSFVEEYEGRLLVNPGSLMRMSADQIDHKPCVYLWYEESNTVKQVILPHEKGVISRHHIEQKQDKEARYQAFIDRLQQEGDPELSFRKNLEKHFQQNKTIRSVKELIYEKMED